MKFRVALALLMALATPAPAGERGAEIYLTGEGIQARVSSAPLPARLAACVNCHRPSGYGVGEGDARVAAIAAPVLFQPLEPRRDILLRDLYQERYSRLAKFDVHHPVSRRAYSGVVDIARALRQGLDPEGRPLSPAMPRYNISDEDIAALTEYLRKLGASPDPGYDETTWRFASIFTPDVPEAQKQAALDVITAFTSRHNRESERERSRPGFSPLYKGEYAAARRDFLVDIWHLTGPPETWGHQLQAHYDSAPPFALLGGIIPGDYSVISGFCAEKHMPCIFPRTGWPGPADDYNVYFSGGYPVEARLIADDMALRGLKTLALIGGESREAQAFARYFRSLGAEEAPLSEADAALLLSADITALAMLDEFNGRVYGSGGLLADEAGALPDFGRSIQLAWRYAPPGRPDPNRQRLRGWLQRTGAMAPGFERTQFETWFALEVASHAMIRLVDRPSRAFFLETVEHMTESITDPGLYPALSLGPGQRIAAKQAGFLQIGR